MPSDDPTTLQFPSSCTTCRQPILFQPPHLRTPIRAVGYKTCRVMTVESERRKGFGRRMMSLLHPLLAIPDSGSLVNSEAVEGAWEGGKDAAVSFLYSEIGGFYKNCGPLGSGEENGQESRSDGDWGASPSTLSTWSVASFPPCNKSDVRRLVPSYLPSLADADCKAILSALSKSSPSTAFAVEPLYEMYEQRIKSTEFRFPRATFTTSSTSTFSLPTCYGLESGERGTSEWNFVVFAPDYSDSALEILRRRGEDPELIWAVAQVARVLGLEKIVAWDQGGKKVPREEMVSCMKVYGVLNGQGTEWKLNEIYASVV